MSILICIIFGIGNSVFFPMSCNESNLSGKLLRPLRHTFCSVNRNAVYIWQFITQKKYINKIDKLGDVNPA